MAKGAAPPASSLYRGFRVTFVQHPDASHGHLTISAKQARSRWDDWDHLVPAIRVDGCALNSLDEVISAAIEALESLRERA